MDNGFILQDRIQKIQQIINKYGVDNFYMSYSGGKDSNVLSALLDMAIPDNKIPRVFADTGIELNAVRDFVMAKAAGDNRIVIIKPATPIKKMLEAEGYPFKSKQHSEYLGIYHRNGIGCKTIQKYLRRDPTVEKYFNEHCCPKKLEYQFAENALDFKVSDKCCEALKVKPITDWQNANKKPYKIIGIVENEGGRRSFRHNGCLTFRHDKLKTFKPLYPVTKEWENWFINQFNVDLPVVYYPPYNFTRTGCKGCPFNKDLQKDLDVLAEYFPNEHKQCEKIWAPVYAEYRRIGYRLRPMDENQLSFFDE